jgi:hypothetical protein
MGAHCSDERDQPTEQQPDHEVRWAVPSGERNDDCQPDEQWDDEYDRLRLIADS